MDMKRTVFFFTLSLAAMLAHAQLTLEECQRRAQDNYPLVRQYGLIEKARGYDLSNAGKGYLPQFSLSGKATYQSDITRLPVEIPNLDIKTASKDQYQVMLEVQPLARRFRKNPQAGSRLYSQWHRHPERPGCSQRRATEHQAAPCGIGDHPPCIPQHACCLYGQGSLFRNGFIETGCRRKHRPADEQPPRTSLVRCAGRATPPAGGACPGISAVCIH